MAYLLFIDESGQDHRQSPYEVLAGAAVHDTQLWNLVCAVQDVELRFFGRRISNDHEELKARHLLNRKTFRLAAQGDAIPEIERTALAAKALEDGAHATRAQLTGQAVLNLRHRARLDRPGYVGGFVVWSFAVIDDLRPTSERDASRLWSLGKKKRQCRPKPPKPPCIVLKSTILLSRLRRRFRTQLTSEAGRECY